MTSLFFTLSPQLGFAMAAAPQLLYLVLLLFLPLLAVAQTHRNISLGTSLSTLDRNPSWASPSGEFAFGFYGLPNTTNLFLLAIWFDKIPEKTLVWSANRDDPVQKRSKVELTADGRFVLTDHQGQEIWRANSLNGAVNSAAMLNTGNFVLMNMDFEYVWESFNSPTDTMLPTQTLVPGRELISRTEIDYSRGRFRFEFQSDGKLALYSTDLTNTFNQSNYWAPDTDEATSQMLFDESGYIYLLRNNQSIIANLTSDSVVSTREFYHRATMDFDGVFRQYAYPKTPQSDGSWSDSWSVVSFKPADICTTELGPLGSGVCGFNSYCRLLSDQRTSCECPPGFSYFDPNEKFKGCKQDFLSQNCEHSGSEEEGQFEIREMLNVDWPWQDYELYNPTTEDVCRKACLRDCLCAVAIFKDDGRCWKKKLPLGYGRADPSVERKALFKVRIGTDPRDLGKRKKDTPQLILIGSILLGSSVFLNFLLLLVISLGSYYVYHKKLQKPQLDSSMSGINLRSFTYRELEEATDGFKEELGRGSFGSVYKGVLELDSRNFVAVKKLDNMAKDGEKEFKTEVSTIGRTYHKNLVQLLGFCEEGANRLLVYEFMAKGSLASFLFGIPRPHWNERVHLAFEIARGLFYLHEECSTQIIHCDIKPQNILLDDNFTARISDFGLAKLLKTNQTRTSTGIRGTRGYVAPEWFKKMAITVKVDVYSFGVLLLEIICCRKNVQLEIENEEKAILVDWACDCHKQGRLDMLVDNDEEVMNDMRRLERLVMVAIWCIQEEPSLRPSMKKVTQMLEGAVEVSVPPDPCSFMSSLD